MKNFSGLTTEEKARLLELEKSVELDKARPIIKKGRGFKIENNCGEIFKNKS